ncbi:regulator of chromosome condensation 1/beta-lactamase-inhibitor protein II [Lipomyces arxii]|uniref:regulator of chromosome condensation 1/beta-lactamase-inhibitor protein II n=1 Tax=Lipomyces arxii TaxID=56418 RepID=UPI0034CFDEC3
MGLIGNAKLSLYSFGSNGRCQLSLPIPDDVSVPTLIPVSFELDQNNQNISLRSNGNHTLLLVSGKLYACGQNTFGECFFQPSSNVTTFREVQLPSAVNLVAAGWQFSVIVMSDSRVYVSGEGLRGELGLGQGVKTTTLATIENFPPAGTSIKQIAAGLAHVVVLLDNGELWGWGYCRKGQLGAENSAAKSMWTPVKISISDDYVPVTICCGREFTAVIDLNGKVLVLYSGKDVLGFVKSMPDSVPSWSDFQCGWSTLHIRDDSGKIISWGNNSHCQHVPANVPEFSIMSCGSEHTIGLDRKGTVYAWGWGEHGNCGNLVDRAAGDVNFNYANAVLDTSELRSGDRVIFLGSGCATSWIGTVST